MTKPADHTTLLHLLQTSVTALQTSWHTLDTLEEHLPFRCLDLDKLVDNLASRLDYHDAIVTKEHLDELLAHCPPPPTITP